MQKRSFNHLFLLSLAAALMTGCAPVKHKSVLPEPNARPVQTQYQPVDMAQLSRYVTASNTATRMEINPLLTIATFSFPPTVHTVGDAVAQVLRTTGYSLAPNLSGQVKETLKQPLPFIDRNLGPMPVQTILTVLMGAEVYDVERDPLHRLINFAVKPAMAKTLGVSDE